MEKIEIWELILDLESRESKNSIKFSPVLHEARCAERMKAWEKLIWFVCDNYQ